MRKAHAQALAFGAAARSANEIAHRFMPCIGHPHRRQCFGAEQPGELYRIAPIRVHPVACAAWNQGWRNHHAGKTKLDDQPQRFCCFWWGLFGSSASRVIRKHSSPILYCCSARSQRWCRPSGLILTFESRLRSGHSLNVKIIKSTRNI